MDKINYGDKSYDVVDTINFSGTKHLIITDNNITLFINKRNNKFYPAMNDLSLVNNFDIPLSYIRKQHLLWYLVEFINERNINDTNSIKKIVKTFKDFIRSSNIERFLYWPLLNDDEFNKELILILRDLEYNLGDTLRAKEPDYIDINVIDIA